MKPSDLNHLIDAVRHLSMARTCMNRMSTDGKTTISKIVGEQIEKICADMIVIEDALGNAHLEIKRLTIGR
jgi:hypothetical protein